MRRVYNEFYLDAAKLKPQPPALCSTRQRLAHDRLQARRQLCVKQWLFAG